MRIFIMKRVTEGLRFDENKCTEKLNLVYVSIEVFAENHDHGEFFELAK